MAPCPTCRCEKPCDLNRNCTCSILCGCPYCNGEISAEEVCFNLEENP